MNVMNYKIVVPIVAIAIIIVSVLGYIYVLNPTQGSISLTGAGATFPYPLLSAMIPQYQQLEANLNLTINYQAIGSGGGISALQSKTVDFAGSDAPLSASDAAKAQNALHIPETIGAVTVSYNLPEIPTGLHLTGQVIADIFAGNVTLWNDQAIQSLNPTKTLPAESILVVHRSDGSGTTFIFTGYLSASSTGWNTAIGQGKTVAWPVGIGSNGNTGVAATVQGTPYAIGYVELAYALQNNMTVAAIQNPAGNWILPSLTTTTTAASSGASEGLPAGSEDWSAVNLLNEPDAQAYPIVSFSYILVYKELNVIPDMTHEKATELVQFLWWMVHDGQNLASNLEYAQLPTNVVQLNEASIQSITFNGANLLTS